MGVSIYQAGQKCVSRPINHESIGRERKITPNGCNGALLNDDGVSRQHAHPIENTYLAKNESRNHSRMFSFRSCDPSTCLDMERDRACLQRCIYRYLVKKRETSCLSLFWAYRKRRH